MYFEASFFLPVLDNLIKVDIRAILDPVTGRPVELESRYDTDKLRNALIGSLRREAVDLINDKFNLHVTHGHPVGVLSDTKIVSGVLKLPEDDWGVGLAVEEEDVILPQPEENSD